MSGASKSGTAPKDAPEPEPFIIVDSTSLDRGRDSLDIRPALIDWSSAKHDTERNKRRLVDRSLWSRKDCTGSWEFAVLGRRGDAYWVKSTLPRWQWDEGLSSEMAE